MGQCNASDSDNDALSFFVTSVGNGTLSLNGQPLQTGAIISSADTLSWTPAANASGEVTAFSVKAFDGAVLSASAVPVVVNTILPPTVSITATRNKASEVNDGVSKGVGVYTITRVHGDLSQPLTVFYGESGTATYGSDYSTLPGSITLGPNVTSATITLLPAPDNLTEPTETAVLSVTPDPTYLVDPKNGSGTVTIADVEYPPDSLAGFSMTAAISGGQVAGGSKTYQLIFSSTDDTYLRIGGGGDFVGQGNYSYHHMTSTVGLVTLYDPSLGEIDGALTFTSKTAASFNFGLTSQMAPEIGKMSVIAPKATAFAPVDIAGRTVDLSIRSGVLPLAAKGSATFVLSQNSDNYVIAGSSGVASSSGTYTYQQFTPNVGLLMPSDSLSAQGLVVLQFTSATAAKFSSSFMNGGSEAGSAKLEALPTQALAPASLNGATMTGTIAHGQAPFASSGSFIIHVATGSYTLTGPGNINSTGTYQYELFNPVAGLFSMDDSGIGQGWGLLTFTSATKARSFFFNDATQAVQQGTMVFS